MPSSSCLAAERALHGYLLTTMQLNLCGISFMPASPWPRLAKGWNSSSVWSSARTQGDSWIALRGRPKECGRNIYQRKSGARRQPDHRPRLPEPCLPSSRSCLKTPSTDSCRLTLDYQKITFTANCAMRGSATCPARNVPKAEFPFSLSKALIWSVPLTAPVLMVSGAKLG